MSFKHGIARFMSYHAKNCQMHTCIHTWNEAPIHWKAIGMYPLPLYNKCRCKADKLLQYAGLGCPIVEI